MQPCGYNFLGLVLSLLLFGLSVVPTPGRAEAQMRCVGMSAQAAPCAAMELPAGLSERQVSGTLMMACCRSMSQKSARHDGCPMHHAGLSTSTSRSVSASVAATHRCLVTVRVAAGRAAAPGVSRARWFLAANPALAPPLSAPAAAPALTPRPAFGPSSPLSPHSQLRLHGLRAPPAA